MIDDFLCSHVYHRLLCQWATFLRRIFEYHRHQNIVQLTLLFFSLSLSVSLLICATMDCQGHLESIVSYVHVNYGFDGIVASM